MTRLALVVAVSLLIAALSACGGGGEGGPSLRLTLEADLSHLPDGADPGPPMAALTDVVERRARAFGLSDVRVERQDTSRLSVAVSGVISEEDARRLLEAKALLELRQPVLDEEGNIVCMRGDGSEFSVAPQGITYVDSGVRRVPRCGEGEGEGGEVVWQTIAVGEGVPIQDPAIVILQPIGATVDRTRSPVLLVNFTTDSGQLLDEITARLAGLPLGIFVDGELIAGPTVSAPITSANLAIAGLSLHEANIIAAQLNGGDLPVPVKVVSVEQAP